MEKNAVVGSDATVAKCGDLEGKFVHLLERESRDGDVGSHSASMFAIRDASNFLIMGGATVAVVHDDLFSGERPQLLEGFNEAALEAQFAATVAGKLGLREVLAQIPHLCSSFVATCAGVGNAAAMKQEFPRRGCEGHHFQIGRFSPAFY